MIKVGIIGAAGYTAGELIRLLVNHPEAEIVFAHSESSAGKFVHELHSGLYGETELQFCASFDLSQVDVLFLCSGHGRSKEFWEKQNPCSAKIIDLAQDYRDESEGYIYGLPELQRDKICQASKIANPGCFATAIILSLLPLAKAGLLNSEVNVNAVTGSTGAGVHPSSTTHFSWRHANISTYKIFEHQHLAEILRSLKKLQTDFTSPLNFVPLRGDFTRGIFATSHVDCSLSEEEAVELYKEYYKDAAFTFVSSKDVNLKEVVNTNKCLLSLHKHSGKLIINSVIDNLLKGASGQAVQNMNLMFNLKEDCGLRLKASAF